MSLSESFRQTLFIALALAFFGFICWIIFQANSGAGNFFVTHVREIRYGDKISHMALYGLLAFLVNPALGYRRVHLFFFAVPLGSLLVLGFAVIEEFTQLSISSRTFEWADICCDLIGIGIASLAGPAVRDFLRSGHS